MTANRPAIGPVLPTVSARPAGASAAGVAHRVFRNPVPRAITAALPGVSWAC